MTTGVGQALELIAAALVGMALLIAMLVMAEQVLLRPRATAAAEPAAPRCPVDTTAVPPHSRGAGPVGL